MGIGPQNIGKRRLRASDGPKVWGNISSNCRRAQKHGKTHAQSVICLPRPPQGIRRALESFPDALRKLSEVPSWGLMGHPGTCSDPPGAPRDLPWLSKRPAGALSNPPWGFPKLFRATKQQSSASSHKLAVTSQRCSRF